MASFFDKLFATVMAHEGGPRYTNHPNDRGGPTKWGIKQKTARACGYDGSMELMSASQAMDIYRREFWERPHIDKLEPISQRLAAKVFDVGVNCGPGTAVELLQSALYISGHHQIVADGLLGNATLEASAQLVADGLLDELMIRICEMQQAHYTEIVANDPSQNEFSAGWAKRANYHGEVVK